MTEHTIVRIGLAGVSAPLFDVNISKQRDRLCAEEDRHGSAVWGRPNKYVYVRRHHVLLQV